MYKILAATLLLSAVSAAPADHQATSFSSFNDNHNSVHHFDSAPSHLKYAVPAKSYYAAPAITKVAVPAVAKVAIPAFTSYHQAPAHQYSSSSHQTYSAPVAPVKLAVPVAKIAPVTYSAPVVKYVAGPSYSEHHEEYAPAKYEFAYSIEDPHTGDFHSQQEQRDGDHVVGQYSLHEADGTVRIVKYFDEGHGFNAVVEKQGHPTEAPAVYKKVVEVAAPHYAHHH